MCPLKYLTQPSFFSNANSLVMWVTPVGNIVRVSWGMERSLPMRGRKRAKSPHPAIIPESSRFGLVALAVTLLFLWAALSQQTILRLHHSTHTGLRSGGLNYVLDGKYRYRPSSYAAPIKAGQAATSRS